MLCHDGASTQDVRKRAALQKDLNALSAEEKSLHERHEQYKASLRAFVYGMMQRGYSAALINGLEFEDTKAIASVLEHSRAMNLDLPQTVSNNNEVTVSKRLYSTTVRPADLKTALTHVRRAQHRIPMPKKTQQLWKIRLQQFSRMAMASLSESAWRLSSLPTLHQKRRLTRTLPLHCYATLLFSQSWV